MKTIYCCDERKKRLGINFDNFPAFHKTGSIKGMKKHFYGEGAYLVGNGSYIYNVDRDTYFKVLNDISCN